MRIETETIEAALPLILAPESATYSRRIAALGVVGALAIPVRHVSPAKWKRALGLNSDGETSRARAIETWPAQAELFARKRDHSRAEAALLGLYALKAGQLEGNSPITYGNI